MAAGILPSRESRLKKAVVGVGELGCWPSCPLCWSKRAVLGCMENTLSPARGINHVLGTQPAQGTVEGTMGPEVALALEVMNPVEETEVLKE